MKENIREVRSRSVSQTRTEPLSPPQERYVGEIKFFNTSDWYVFYCKISYPHLKNLKFKHEANI